MAALSDQLSMDGSVASVSRPLTIDSRLMVLFDFVEYAPGVGLLSHVIRQQLPESEEDAVAMMKIYVGSKRQLAIRWKAKKPNDTSSWHLIPYVSTAKSKDTVIRVGKAVLISDDKDSLSTMRTKMIKSLTASGDRKVAGRPKAQCQLQFLEEQDKASFPAMLNSGLDGEAGQFSSEKRPYEDIEQELAETDVKIAKLEEDNRQLKQKVLELQEEISAFKEDPVQLLTETVRAQTIVVQRYIERLGGNQSAIGQLLCTPGPSLDAVTSINSENTPVKLYGKINIDKQKLRQATLTGRMKTQNPARRLNATVSVLLSGWWTKSELSLFILAGRACPSIPGSKSKAKFPEEVMEAINS